MGSNETAVHSLLLALVGSTCLLVRSTLGDSDSFEKKKNHVGDVRCLFTHAKPVQVDYRITAFTIRLNSNISKPIWIILESLDVSLAYPLSTNLTFSVHDALTPKVIQVFANNVGTTTIKVAKSSNSPSRSLSKQYGVQIIVVHSLFLQIVNAFIGAGYSLAWSVGMYPQVYINFKRKSVVGLNFDFLAYNIAGFLAHSCFNGGLYFSKKIQEEYFQSFPGAVIPVLPSDVFFTFHGVLIAIITIIQCALYDKGGQSVSRLAKTILLIIWAFTVISFVPAYIGKITWLLYLDFLSYVKLLITLIKYFPQAYMNYNRKCTRGWSIGSVLCDVTGGLLSLVQMFIIAYNNNQWNSVFGNLTKFGLGLFSILFDILFVTQHYMLYPRSGKAVKKCELFHGCENKGQE